MNPLYKYFIILTLTAFFILPARAAGYRSTGKETRREQKELKTAQKVDLLITNADFQFVPKKLVVEDQEYTLPSYLYMKVTPQWLAVRLSKVEVSAALARKTSCTLLEQTESKWFITWQTDVFPVVYNFEYTIDRKTAEAQLRITDNQGNDYTYTGRIHPN